MLNRAILFPALRRRPCRFAENPAARLTAAKGHGIVITLPSTKSAAPVAAGPMKPGSRGKDIEMPPELQTGLLVTLVVGLIAGWLAGKIVRGSGFGLIGDLVIGVIGAFIGRWLWISLLHLPLIFHN